MGVDGCGAPNYALPLVRLARLYARLAAPSGADAAEAALATLRAAMRAHPEMVSGEGRDDLLLARLAPWIAKGGAEGVHALGVAERGIGIAIKIADGGPRALRIVIAAVLEQLGLWPAAGADGLDTWRRVALRNHAGRLTGYLLPVFELRRGRSVQFVVPPPARRAPARPPEEARTMPTYEYHCRKCGEVFDVLEHLAEHEKAPHRCPKCQSEDVEPLPTAFVARTSKKS
jgi:putative FmdB family regulatory protein